MIKYKDITVSIDNIVYYFSIDYEADGTILTVCIENVDIKPIINESVLERIIDVFNGTFDDEN